MSFIKLFSTTAEVPIPVGSEILVGAKVAASSFFEIIIEYQGI